MDGAKSSSNEHRGIAGRDLASVATFQSKSVEPIEGLKLSDYRRLHRAT